MATGRVLQLEDILDADSLGCGIANQFHTWYALSEGQRQKWQEIYRYIYATDTRTTSNSSAPWKNTTTTPKLTQIRDNLFANYMAAIFPKRRWLTWEGADAESDTKDKEAAIKTYAEYMISYPGFKDTLSRLILDFIDNGNCFPTVDWLDERVDGPRKLQTGYVGPVARRISPFDIVFNPTAPDFYRAPKIVRSLVSLGDLEELMQRLSNDDDELLAAKECFNYLLKIRQRAATFSGDITAKDAFYNVDGFTSFRNYLDSGTAEVLTFYGDFYNSETGEFFKNRIIQVVDRHKVIRNTQNPSDMGYPSVFHAGWRLRQDNLWAMGPLENLVGMQYRLDHIENLKADFFDLVTFPPLKIRGYVEDFQWAPFSKIYTGDEGDVEVVQTQHNPLQANFELQMLEAKMEELAGAPKEAMGFRTPGEKTAYEVQRLENAASRIFQNKIAQFEEQVLEPLLNAMMEMARRQMDDTTVRVLDDEYKIATFKTLTAEDIVGVGRVRPIGARHFAEVSERVQNITSFFSSAVGMNPQVAMHFSGIETAKLFEELLDIGEYKIVQPYIQLTEQAEAQRIALQNDEDTEMGAMTPSGMTPDDSDESFLG